MIGLKEENAKLKKQIVDLKSKERNRLRFEKQEENYTKFRNEQLQIIDYAAHHNELSKVPARLKKLLAKYY